MANGHSQVRFSKHGEYPYATGPFCMAVQDGFGTWSATPPIQLTSIGVWDEAYARRCGVDRHPRDACRLSPRSTYSHPSRTLTARRISSSGASPEYCRSRSESGRPGWSAVRWRAAPDAPLGTSDGSSGAAVHRWAIFTEDTALASVAMLVEQAREKRARATRGPDPALTVTFDEIAAAWLEHRRTVGGCKRSSLTDCAAMLRHPGERSRKRGRAPKGRIMAAFGGRTAASITTRELSR